ncbi:LicD family protein, partial [Psychrilyobacter sp.]
MLLVVDEICKKNNIKYWISYGTFLGAVRHSG